MAPTFRHGKGTYLAYTTGGSTKALSTGFADASLKRAVDTAEATVYGDTDRRYLAGVRDTTISFSGNFSSTHEKQLGGLIGISTGIIFIYGPEGSGTGRRKYLLPSIITKLDVASPVADKVSMDCELQAVGALTSTTFA